MLLATEQVVKSWNTYFPIQLKPALRLEITLVLNQLKNSFLNTRVGLSKLKTHMKRSNSVSNAYSITTVLQCIFAPLRARVGKNKSNKYFELKNSWGADGVPQTRTTC